MNTSTRYFLFFIILFVPSFLIAFKGSSNPNVGLYVLVVSLFIPLVTLPLYRRKNIPVNPSVLVKEAKYGSRYSKIGLIIGGVLGFIYSSVIIDVCSGSSSNDWCFAAVGIIIYVLACAFGGFVLGAIIGSIVDFSKTRKQTSDPHASFQLPKVR